MTGLLLAAAAFASWLYLVFGRGFFWLCAERDDGTPPTPAVLPKVVAVVPARNEADAIARSIGSLFAQDYPALSIVLVDDDSNDHTGTIARNAAAHAGAVDRLTVVAGRPLPSGWTGKLWAEKQGIDAAETLAPKYLWLTDADITHAPDTLSWLVAQAESRSLVLTSLTAKWRCENLAERVHIPAFIFFFQMLYPFRWVNRPDHTMAGAAGGVMLVRPDALRAAGGIEVIRNALIDDCALAAAMKRQGPIWLGLTDRSLSIRPYPAWVDVHRMVSRSAYAQLRYSPLLLVGTTLGMALTYLVPPLMAVFGSGWAQVLGIATWLLMSASFQPTLRYYRVSPLWGLALPAITFLYMLYTLDSAYQYATGRGGSWKGRVQAKASGPT